MSDYMKYQFICFDLDYIDAKENPNELFNTYHKQIKKICNTIAHQKNLNKDEVMSQAFEYFVKFCKKYDPYFNFGFYRFKNSFFSNLWIHLLSNAQRYYFDKKRETTVSPQMESGSNNSDSLLDIINEQKITDEYTFEVVDLLNKIDPIHKKLFLLTGQGYKQDEIGEKLKISQSRVSVLRRNIFKIGYMIRNDANHDYAYSSLYFYYFNKDFYKENNIERPIKNKPYIFDKKIYNLYIPQKEIKLKEGCLDVKDFTVKEITTLKEFEISLDKLNRMNLNELEEIIFNAEKTLDELSIKKYNKVNIKDLNKEDFLKFKSNYGKKYATIKKNTRLIEIIRSIITTRTEKNDEEVNYIQPLKITQENHLESLNSNINVVQKEVKEIKKDIKLEEIKMEQNHSGNISVKGGLSPEIKKKKIKFLIKEEFCVLNMDEPMDVLIYEMLKLRFINVD